MVLHMHKMTLYKKIPKTDQLSIKHIKETQELICWNQYVMRRGDWYGSSELWCMMGPSSNDVDFTAWLLGSLQAKRCVRPVNRVRVHLSIDNVVEET